MPEKKKGTDRHIASSIHVQIALIDAVTTGASVICTARHRNVVSAKAALDRKDRRTAFVL